MEKEICQHGHDITNTMHQTCPEGCISNNQRGAENRQLASELADVKAELSTFRKELSRCFDIAQLLDAQEPDAPGSFTGTVAERLERGFKRLMEQRVGPQDAVDLLNKALELDRKAIQDLIEAHTPCNDALAQHDTIQVAIGQQRNCKPSYCVGLLGMFNGLFGVDSKGYGPVQVVFSTENKHIYRFEVRQGWKS